MTKAEQQLALAGTRALLISLLRDMAKIEPPFIISLEGLGDTDKWALLGMSCSEMIVEVMWATSGKNVAEAQKGFDCLAKDIRARIDARAEGEGRTLQ